MEYGMLGEDQASELDKLSKYTGIVDWSYIKAACLNDALFHVDPSLSLEEVGKAFTDDDSEKIKSWMTAGDLTKMERIHGAYFDMVPETLFEALVVSPFVLCREHKKDEE